MMKHFKSVSEGLVQGKGMTEKKRNICEVLRVVKKNAKSWDVPSYHPVRREGGEADKPSGAMSLFERLEKGQREKITKKTRGRAEGGGTKLRFI